MLCCIPALVSFASAAANLQVLTGHVPPAAKSLAPAARLPGTNELDLVFGLPLRNRDALTNLLKEIYDPRGTNFHRYLTPAEFAAQFGPTANDYQKLIAFAQAHGMEVTGTHPNRTLLDVRASVSAIEKALHIGLRVYPHPKQARTFYAPDANPSVDSGVKILSIGGLNDFSPPQPMNLRVTPLAESQGPSLASNVAGSGPRGFLVGRDFRAAYAPGVALTGAGQSVGLFEIGGYYPSDITSYETLAGMPHTPLKNVLVNGVSGKPNDSNIEIALDICMAISMAPGLDSVIVYEGRTPNDILNRMATDNLARQLSSSWSWAGFGDEETTEQILMQYAAQGQSFFESSGDDGAYCGVIDTPADSPYATVVGGTVIATSQPGGALISEVTWPYGGGGVATNYTIPSYQKGVDMSRNGGSSTLRNIPDVACVAQDIWLIANNGEQFSGSGTSASAPLWAGFAALVNQQAQAEGKPPIGFINPAIYALGSSSDYGAALRDITEGNNTNACGADKFLALPGYDLCTGWGAPNGSNTINALLAPADALRISPPSPITFSGPPSGPFLPSTATFALTNTSSQSVNWSLTSTSAWLQVSSASGTLPPGSPAAVVSVKPNATATGFSPGKYIANLEFTNLNDSFGQTRAVVLAIYTAPVITSQPAGQPVFDGTAASFTVGTEPNALLFYQWRFDNGAFMTNLSNGDGIAGADSATLTIASATATNVGAYSVVVSNAAGAVTSDAAYLTIVPWRPAFATQPADQTALPGQTVTFSATVAGSKPLFFQWRKNGTNLFDASRISGANTTALVISNVVPGDAGSYTLAVSNALGSAASTNAVLTVTPITSPQATMETLYSFAGTPGGGHPNGLIQAADGKFYGTTQRGGSNYMGSIIRYAPAEGVSTVHWFSGTNDGANPFSPLLPAPDGGFYGTAFQGGSADNGTVFRMNPDGEVVTLANLDIPVGDLPYAGLVWGPDSNLYGTAYQGGSGGRGTAFKITTNGALTVLYAFTNGVDGGHIAAELCLADDGMFYGTTYKGGAGGNGVVYRVATNGVMATLASFYKTNGAFPYAPLVLGDDGNLYGTTSQGGPAAFGNIFRVTKSGQITNLYYFTNGVDGSFPIAGLVLGADGNFYGSTAFGGAYGFGAVFRYSPASGFTPLAQFTGFNGANPQAKLTQASDGYLYGTTQNGGGDDEGVIFRVGGTGAPQITLSPASKSVFAGETVRFNAVATGAPLLSYQWLKNGTNYAAPGNGAGLQTRTLILTNVTVNDEGSYALVVANSLGAATSSIAVLTVTSSPPFFVLQPTNQTVSPGVNVTLAAQAQGDLPLAYQWQKNGIAVTNSAKVSGANSPTLTLQTVTEANNGVYAVVVSNALATITSSGAALTVIPSSSPGTRLATLYSFTGGVNGRVPNGLAQGPDGDLYGTTQFGGSHLVGTVFRAGTNGGLNFLASLGAENGSLPRAGVTLGTNGNWFGTTSSGGEGGVGSVFRMAPDGALTNLHTFFEEVDGGSPLAGLILATNGLLYGTSQTGGTGYGTVYSIAFDGGLSTLYSFTNGVDGASPTGALVQAADGNFYGMTPAGALGWGNIYRVSPSGQLANLYTFKGGTDGWAPAGALVQGTDGNFYGTTTRNSISGFQFYGTIFRVTPAGALSTIYAFNGIISTDGAYPHAGLLLANDGCFYGTTYQGGASGNGTIFRVGPDGAFSTLASFDGFNDGARPEAALIQGADGSLYGTTTTGGYGGFGTLFRLSFTGSPQIITSPSSQTVFTGARVLFSVAASGAPQLLYQWKRNGTPLTDGPGIAGAKARILVLTDVTTANAGTYSVTVSNSLGFADSSGAQLVVNSAPPAITRQPTNQTAAPGATVLFAVTATGNLPLAYQWRFDGASIPGASNSSLLLTNVQYANAGNYSVYITNTLGSITSAAAGLRVPAVLTAASTNGSLTLTWLPPYVLQSATNVAGPYYDVPGATSPFVIVTTSAPEVFYRLRASTAATLATPLWTNGQISFGVAGLSGYRYLVQASTNLTAWTPIQTNPAPFTFTDPASAQFRTRFYRTLLLP
jgi:uncharacterized repeat protein (TIGR03803 family)